MDTTIARELLDRIIEFQCKPVPEGVWIAEDPREPRLDTPIHGEEKPEN